MDNETTQSKPQPTDGHNIPTSEHTNSIPIYAQHKRVGAVVGTTFHKDRVKASSGFLRHPPAIALSVDSLEDALDAGATEVQVTDIESGMVYRAPMQTILMKGWEFCRGAGMQVGLELKFWNTHKAGPRQLSLFSAHEEEG